MAKLMGEIGWGPESVSELKTSLKTQDVLILCDEDSDEAKTEALLRAMAWNQWMVDHKPRGVVSTTEPNGK